MYVEKTSDAEPLCVGSIFSATASKPPCAVCWKTPAVVGKSLDTVFEARQRLPELSVLRLPVPCSSPEPPRYVEYTRLVASAAYTLARAANADLDISDAETTIIEQALQQRGSLDEATAVLVAEMAKFQARTVGGTEDYVVTREFAALATDEQKADMLRACFVISAASGSISAEESAEVNQIAKELDVDRESVNAIRNEFAPKLAAIQRMLHLRND